MSVDYARVRFEVIETVLYLQAMEEGDPLSQSMIKGAHKQLLSTGRDYMPLNH